MASLVIFLIFVSGIYPIVCAIWASRKTTLVHAAFWALATWLAWSSAVCFDALGKNTEPVFPHYLALALTGCASIAVLGARRPGVVAWNFVVLGLLVVMMFLWFEGRLAENDLILLRVQKVLLASTVAIGVLNYLPTRAAPTALLLAFGSGLEMVTLSEPPGMPFEPARQIAWLIVALAPWVAYVRMRQQPLVPSEFDQIWLRFRDSFGMVWAQRLREQFNQSAKNSDWPVVLRWQGLRLAQGAPSPSPEVRQAMLATLRALMKRFEI